MSSELPAIESRLRSVESTSQLLLRVTRRKVDAIETGRELARLIALTRGEHAYPAEVLRLAGEVEASIQRYDHVRTALDEVASAQGADEHAARVTWRGESYTVRVEARPADDTGATRYHWIIDGWDGPALTRWLENPAAALLEGVAYLVDGLTSDEEER